MWRLPATFIVAGVLAAGGVRQRPSRPPAGVVSDAQIVLMAPLKSSTLGSRGFELVIMNLDGSNRRQLTDNDRQEFLPHFSPDGSRILYTTFTFGSYGQPGSQTDVAVYDFASGTEINLTKSGKDSYPVWSPDGLRIAFLSTRSTAPPEPHLWIMNADGSQAHEITRPSGTPDDVVWGDVAWSSRDWILFVVAQNIDGCFKTRLDKIRPDGSDRTKVTDGGPNCTPAGMEQSGDADPGFSADGLTIYTSRGYPWAPAGGAFPMTERKLVAFSSDAWFPGKAETDLSLRTQPSCIEGVPKGSPDGAHVLVFRACFDEATFRGGIYLTDAAGSYRTWIADGFGPDWNPLR
jgi:hypothetical protein